MPAPSPLATPEAWNLVAADYAAEIVPMFERYADVALDLAEVGPTDRILDVATGPGTLALRAAARVKHVTAVDFSPPMIERLRERAASEGIANVEASVGDGHALMIASDAMDAVFSMFGLFLFADRARGFGEIHRVLRPERRAVVASWSPMEKIPAFAILFGALRELMPGLPFGQGAAPLGSPDAIHQEMGSAGFARVDVQPVTFASTAPSLAEFWASLVRTMAPLALLKSKLGPDKWDPLGSSIYQALEAKLGPGAIPLEMEALLGVGTK